jgi:DNA-binding response OmpR family regulator
VAENGRAGLELVRRCLPDLVILDLMLPELDGMHVCEEIREDLKTQDTPIIMLTARDEQMSVIEGLSKGADDYVTKPFSPRELLARARAVSKRGSLIAPQTGILEEGRLRLSKDEVSLSVDGNPIPLTRTEFKLLYLLASHPGEAFTRDQILDRVFGKDAYVIDRNIDVHIRSIRKKVGIPDLIGTIRGYGYRFKASAAQRQAG